MAEASFHVKCPAVLHKVIPICKNSVSAVHSQPPTPLKISSAPRPEQATTSERDHSPPHPGVKMRGTVSTSASRRPLLPVRQPGAGDQQTIPPPGQVRPACSPDAKPSRLLSRSSASPDASGARGGATLLSQSPTAAAARWGGNGWVLSAPSRPFYGAGSCTGSWASARGLFPCF